MLWCFLLGYTINKLLFVEVFVGACLFWIVDNKMWHIGTFVPTMILVQSYQLRRISHRLRLYFMTLRQILCRSYVIMVANSLNVCHHLLLRTQHIFDFNANRFWRWVIRLWKCLANFGSNRNKHIDTYTYITTYLYLIFLLSFVWFFPRV